MYIVFWLFYYIVPAIFAWKKRTLELSKCVYSLFGTMIGIYLAVWCENIIHKSLENLVPSAEIKLWVTTASLLVIWFVAATVFRFAVNKLVPEGLAMFEFPEKVCKFAVPLIFFLHWGLIMAMLFTVFSVSPAARYVNVFSLDKSMCSGARCRMLWNIFLIDRFSWQPVGINARRTAFDRFVPQDPARVLHDIAEAKRKKAEAEAAAVAAKLAEQKAAREKAEAEAKAREEAERKKQRIKRRKKRYGRIIIYQEKTPGGEVVAIDQTPELPDEDKKTEKKRKKKKKDTPATPAAPAASAGNSGEPTGMLTKSAKEKFDKMPDNRLKKELGKMLFNVQKNQKSAVSVSK